MQLNEFFSKVNSKHGRELTFIAILIVGGTLSFLTGVWIMTDLRAGAFHIWVAWILLITAATVLVYLGYVAYRTLST